MRKREKRKKKEKKKKKKKKKKNMHARGTPLRDNRQPGMTVYVDVTRIFPGITLNWSASGYNLRQVGPWPFRLRTVNTINRQGTLKEAN